MRGSSGILSEQATWLHVGWAAIQSCRHLHVFPMCSTAPAVRQAASAVFHSRAWRCVSAASRADERGTSTGLFLAPPFAPCVKRGALPC